MSDWRIEVDKSEMPKGKMFIDSYFDLCCATDVGSKIDKLSLTADEICLLMLPFITKDDVDRCLINSALMSKYLLKLVYKINPGIDPNFAKINNINNPLYYAWLKQSIRTTDHYDFLPIYRYIETFIVIPEAGDPEIIKKLLKISDKSGTNFLSWCICTMLHTTDSTDHVVHFILDNFCAGCNIDTADHTNNTPLIWACCKKIQRDITLKMIDKLEPKCNVGFAGKFSETALLWACRNKLSDVALKMLDKFGTECNIKQVNSNHETALLMACRNNLTDVAIKIIEISPDCNAGQVNHMNDTALLWACGNNMIDVILLVIDKCILESNIGHANNTKTTVLIFACKRKLTDVAMKILNSFSDCNTGQIDDLTNTALIWACKNGMTEVAIKIIDTYATKCNIKHANRDGETALTWACKNDLTEVVERIHTMSK